MHHQDLLPQGLARTKLQNPLKIKDTELNKIQGIKIIKTINLLIKV
jgi:hypothetical protein